ncbi:hypothetical protein IFR05_015209 [Cadophora sp. M221]|nr:hypothetical protein IFR05_015209 [Cadophora sp. M221]
MASPGVMTSQDTESSDNSKNRSLLCRLSNELLCMVASNVTNPSDLSALARTCKLLHGNSTPVLYKSVVINDEGQLRQLAAGRDLYGPYILERVQQFDLSMDWNDSKILPLYTINHIGDMANLQHLAIEYDYLKYGQNKAKWSMLLPKTLPSKLVSCTLSFKSHGAWPISQAVPLLQHTHLRRLELHWAMSDRLLEADGQDLLCKFPGSTALETLNLIDCDFNSVDLHQIMCYPRALRSLSSHSDRDVDEVRPAIARNHDYCFRSISTDGNANSLESFRYDMKHRNEGIVPAPGMDLLKSVRYLDIHHEHLAPVATFMVLYPFEEIDSPIERLLPPRLEVLKISKFAANKTDIVDEILENKNTIAPALRRIILVLQYRDAAMADELRRAADAEMDTRHWSDQTFEMAERNFPVSRRKKTYKELSARCKGRGVDLMLLYEDSVRREVLREGAGPALWEIPEHIA